MKDSGIVLYLRPDPPDFQQIKFCLIRTPFPYQEEVRISGFFLCSLVPSLLPRIPPVKLASWLMNCTEINFFQSFTELLMGWGGKGSLVPFLCQF